MRIERQQLARDRISFLKFEEEKKTDIVQTKMIIYIFRNHFNII